MRITFGTNEPAASLTSTTAGVTRSRSARRLAKIAPRHDHEAESGARERSSIGIRNGCENRLADRHKPAFFLASAAFRRVYFTVFITWI
jgi:hypothetical protein